MKRLLTLTLALIVGFALIQMVCEEVALDEGQETHDITSVTPDFPPVENLQFTVIDEGAAIDLTWGPPIGAEPEEYLVVLDSTEEISTTAEWQDVHTPCALVEVYAVYPEGRSEPRALFFGAEQTAELVLWATEWYSQAPCSRTEVIPDLAGQHKGERWEIEVRATDHPNPDDPAGFGFAEDGSAVAYDLSDTTTWPEVDFFIVDIGYGDLAIAGSEDHIPPLNDKVNGVSDPIQSNYDDLDTALSFGYYTYTEIEENGLYSLLIEWDVQNGHYAKVLVARIDGYQVTLRLAYQLVAELRWLVVGKHVTGIKED